MGRKINMVSEFNSKMGISRPTKETLERFILQRIGFMQEELSELSLAASKQDPAKLIDALVDLDYFLAGTIDLLDLEPIFDEAFNAVHTANMRKHGAATKRGYDAAKGADWVAPIIPMAPFKSALSHWYVKEDDEDFVGPAKPKTKIIKDCSRCIYLHDCFDDVNDAPISLVCNSYVEDEYGE